MKSNTRFLVTVLALLFGATFMLLGCMYAVAEGKSPSKPYDMDIVAETVIEQGTDVVDDTPTAQTELQKKFSDMAEISEDGKSITVISEEFLAEYWEDIESSGKSKALTTEEVLYIIQDSVRLYFECTKYVLPANFPYVNEHAKILKHAAILNGTLTAFPLGESMLENNYSHICCDINMIILYRLAALSTADAFVFADEMLRSTGYYIDSYNTLYSDTVFYIPSDTSGVDTDTLIKLLQGKGDLIEQDDVRIFTINFLSTERIEFFDGSSSIKMFPTAEMEATQSNRVVEIVDLTVTQGILTTSQKEIFWETEKFFYYFPSEKSSYVIAKLYDGREMLLTEALEEGYITPLDFDDFDFEYFRFANHADTGHFYLLSDFHEQTFYTDKSENDAALPYAMLINSMDELKRYTSLIKEKGIYATDRGTHEILSFDEWVAGYTEEWFEKNSLIIAVIEADSRIMPKVGGAYISTSHSRIDLSFRRETLGYKKDQVYTVFIAMPKVKADAVSIRS